MCVCVYVRGVVLVSIIAKKLIQIDMIEEISFQYYTRKLNQGLKFRLQF